MHLAFWSDLAASDSTEVLFGWLLIRAIAAPIVAMTSAMRWLADGDTTVALPTTDRGDEIGRMAAAVQVFKDAALDKARLEGEAVEQKRLVEAERTKAAETRAFVVTVVATGLERLVQ